MSTLPRSRWSLPDRIPGPIFAKELNAAGRRRTTYWLRGLFVLGMAGLVGISVSGQIVRSLDATSLARVQGLDGPAWQSGLWMLRSKHLFLIPGDSPVGFRLPLPSLPAEPPSAQRQIYPVDPAAPRPPLPMPVPMAVIIVRISLF